MYLGYVCFRWPISSMGLCEKTLSMRGILSANTSECCSAREMMETMQLTADISVPVISGFIFIFILFFIRLFSLLLLLLVLHLPHYQRITTIIIIVTAKCVTPVWWRKTAVIHTMFLNIPDKLRAYFLFRYNVARSEGIIGQTFYRGFELSTVTNRETRMWINTPDASQVLEYIP